MASTANFSLPIAPTSTPNAPGAGGGFNQPSGVSIGPPLGSYGAVGSTHPGVTNQSTVSTRSQVRFQVQPQVTIAVNPTYPLSEDVRRKDFLMTLMDKTNNSKVRKYTYKGTPVMGLKQTNEALRLLAEDGEGTPMAKLIKQALNGKSVKDPFEVVKIIHPFGVYNNRVSCFLLRS